MVLHYELHTLPLMSSVGKLSVEQDYLKPAESLLQSEAQKEIYCYYRSHPNEVREGTMWDNLNEHIF